MNEKCVQLMKLHECVEGDREELARSEGTVSECCGEEGAARQWIHFSDLHLWSRALGNGLRNQNIHQCPSQGGQAPMDLKDERCLG